MISRKEIKLIRSLYQKKYRDEEELFVVEGEKSVEEALRSGFEVIKVFRISEIGEEAMSRITLLSSPSPALALVRKPAPLNASQIDNLIALRPLSLGLDSIRDPGNLGTIIRLAEWFGIGTIFASRDTVDCFNPKVVQASMGSIFRTQIIYCDLLQIASEFRAAGMSLFGTFLDGKSIYEESLGSNGLIVMGSESNGISPALESLVTHRITIPSFSPASEKRPDSLNVALATAIICSEFRRR
ncbi:MAG TPA: RNA methyltransferase [Bacteroidales bacterium]|nr:RNA methyltransferase [Bacteroidales bacterium]HPK30598.1 RNA methyltransferase [Bacteroidales bacterium]